MVPKVSGWSRKFPDSLESFRIVWKVSGWSEYYPGGPESFDNPEKILLMPKVTRQSSIILDGETISHVFFQCFENVLQNELAKDQSTLTFLYCKFCLILFS